MACPCLRYGIVPEFGSFGLRCASGSAEKSGCDVFRDGGCTLGDRHGYSWATMAVAIFVAACGIIQLRSALLPQASANGTAFSAR